MMSPWAAVEVPTRPAATTSVSWMNSAHISLVWQVQMTALHHHVTPRS